jgi:phospholipid/cholesterol/gamma-HCH transport system substrate-binding protein
VYRDATVLLRPKTGLKDMVAELTPGHRSAGPLHDGDRIPVSQTLPDVNLDEILSSLDADTRDYLRLLLGDGGQALEGNGRALAQTIRRFEPTELLAQRSRNIRRVVHNFSLLTDELGRRDKQVSGFVSSSNAVFAALARQDANLRATLRQLPPALGETQTALGKAKGLADQLGPTLQALRPGARALGPSLRQTRPFLRQTAPVIRDELRPFTRAALPTVQELRPAMNDLSAAAPDLTASFEVINALLNTLAFNPPGEQDEGYLFWQSWLNHMAPTVFSTQDAHGPIRHGVVVMTCGTLGALNVAAESNAVLGTLVALLNAPEQGSVCPKSSQAPGIGGG